jgi:ferritin
MPSKNVLAKLNEQINLEFFSSNLYLQMAAWCERQGLRGSALFLGKHAGEEMLHMRKLFDYVNETGNLAVLGRIEAPPTDYSSLGDLFVRVLEHERQVTAKINAIVEIAFQEKDFATFNFMQWYVSEQHEEELMAGEIVGMVKLVGSEGQGLYLLDREIASIAARPPRENPANAAG